MSLFFQPNKRFSNELRVKDRKGREARRMLAKRERQEPLAGTKTILTCKDENKLSQLLELRNKRQEVLLPQTKCIDCVTMVSAGIVVCAFGTHAFFDVPIAILILGVLAIIPSHIFGVVGQCFARGTNLKIWISLMAIYVSVFGWLVLIMLRIQND